MKNSQLIFKNKIVSGAIKAVLSMLIFPVSTMASTHQKNKSIQCVGEKIYLNLYTKSDFFNENTYMMIVGNKIGDSLTNYGNLFGPIIVKDRDQNIIVKLETAIQKNDLYFNELWDKQYHLDLKNGRLTLTQNNSIHIIDSKLNCQ
ncbi:MAG: hypothetical protein ACK4VO_02880 [Pseudobdellovibrio sp.]